jgi:hypothetical protein
MILLILSRIILQSWDERTTYTLIMSAIFIRLRKRGYASADSANFALPTIMKVSRSFISSKAESKKTGKGGQVVRDCHAPTSQDSQ